jgi:prepilin-type N-terminal cleavage/methylation domain-containing protein
MHFAATNPTEEEVSDYQAKRNKEAGFTLVELILVIALGAMIILAAMQLYTRARDSAVQDTYVQSLQSILAGVSEYRMYKGAIPAATGWSQATGLTNYVDSNLQSLYGYNCASGVLTVTTPSCDNNEQATRILTKLMDQRTCDTGSAINGTDSTKVDCIIPSFNGSAGC